MSKNILHIPSLSYFNDDWNILQNFLKHRGNPPFHIDGDLDLRNTSIKDLGNLTSVGGDLNLFGTPIKSFGNLKSVGGGLELRRTPISKKYTEKKIRQMVNVEGKIFI